MNLIRQSRLIFRRGASEKIYEIELCETSAAPPNRYVVNYRYGRRGGTFKEGSKTVTPVSRVEADQIFDHLEEAQLLKGYQREGAAGAAPPPATSTPSSGSGLGSRLSGRTPTPSTTSAGTSASGGTRRRVSAPTSAPAATASRSPSGDARRDRVLARLDEGDSVAGAGGRRGGLSGLRATFTRHRRGARRTATPVAWPLERAIWRAGELRLVDAVPRLIELIGTKDAQRDYCIAWALGRIDERSALGALNRLYRDVTGHEMVVRMAGEAVRALLDETELQTFREEVARKLPDPLRTQVLQGGEGADDALAESLGNHLESSGHKAWKAVERLYLIDNDTTRAVLKSLLRQMPLKAPMWRAARHIFKAAEFRLDAEIFGLLAWRMATTRASFKRGRYSSYVRDEETGGYVRLDMTTLGRPDAKYGYGSDTRAYMRRRVWRTLRRLGELGDEAFVPMAVGVLLPFSDNDKRTERTGWKGRGQALYGEFASYWAFNHLLYTHSESHHPDRANLRWWEVIQAPSGRRSRSSVRSRRGSLSDRTVSPPPQQGRTEAFPELWNDNPGGLLHLLDESRCRRVHQFAVAALRDNTQALERMPIEAVCMLITARYKVTVELGVELARARDDGSAPDQRLVIACARSSVQAARQLAFDWINRHPEHFTRDGKFLAELITSQWDDTRVFARGLIRGLTLTEEAGRTLVARLVASLMALGKGKQSHEEQIASDVADLLFRVFRQHLTGLGEQVIADLLRHPLQSVQALGGDILLNHDTLAASPPESLLLALLQSKHAEVRALGLRLMGQLSDAALGERSMILVALATHSEADLRAGAIEHLKRLAQIGDLGQKMAESLIRALVGQKIRGDGADYAVEALREALKGHLPALPMDSIWRLLKSKTKAGQSLGGLLLEAGVKAETLTVDEMARLSRHEILTVREAAWAFYRQSVARIKADMVSAVRVFDSEWADSRTFAFEFFSDGDVFTREAFTPQILVGICDSVRPDVQLFGRRLITQYFNTEDGVEYMLKLAEHPSIDIQLFVSQYLEDYAAGHADRVEALEPYFAGVLARVNRGGVAKARVFGFFEAQASVSAELAAPIARLLARQSATIAITDRARCIEIMTSIQRRWPDIELPLVARPPEARGAISGQPANASAGA
ncbi:MAG: hypothetical protein ACE366_29765 [Bradymonadia bacterium]